MHHFLQLSTVTQKPQFLHSLEGRANARNVSFETLNDGQFMLNLSTQLIIPNYLVQLYYNNNNNNYYYNYYNYYYYYYYHYYYYYYHYYYYYYYYYYDAEKGRYIFESSKLRNTKKEGTVDRWIGGMAEYLKTRNDRIS